MERSLAYVLVALIAVSVIAFFAIMIGTGNGMAQADFDTPLWRAITFAPWVGLPGAFIIVIALVLGGGRGRSRANSRSGVTH
ncbi:multidrug ABC transporter ATPase [Mycetocola spongiae]|uniref:multidrug ABC transporter ATPase n=1 Tax=Mycetocola spongiae TaxID=2859226 RepID=UPI001CF18859|nr:multidrug ABC transporter ATPase [Mycetocola spongiae]UCR88794.1 multidrug ABC transporter ATPase [Mycetocola spongiae]